MKLRPLLPESLRDHLRLLTHRQAVTPIADWDGLIPPEQAAVDADAGWTEVRGIIDAHAAAGTLDDSHGDLTGMPGHFTGMGLDTGRQH